MKVFITGATGFIGYQVAQAYRRAGHRVWGMARNELKARRLAENEIIPVIGDMREPESYRSVAESCSILIHAAAEISEHSQELDRKTVLTLLDVSQRQARPKTLIYTSGSWDYGNTGPEPADENACARPPAIVSGRPETVRLILEAKGVMPVVIRSGIVYGKHGSLTGMWFEGAYRHQRLEIVGSAGARKAMVHVDDLAQAYLHAGERGVQGEIFNVTDGSCHTVGDLLLAVGRAARIESLPSSLSWRQAEKRFGLLAEALGLDQAVDSSKAAAMLRWVPRHKGFAEGAAEYYTAWKAFFAEEEREISEIAEI